MLSCGTFNPPNEFWMPADFPVRKGGRATFPVGHSICSTRRAMNDAPLGGRDARDARRTRAPRFEEMERAEVSLAVSDLLAWRLVSIPIGFVIIGAILLLDG